MLFRFLTTTAGLTLANFVYQAFTLQAWGVAVERSYFQIVALIAIGTLLYLSPVEPKASQD